MFKKLLQKHTLKTKNESKINNQFGEMIDGKLHAYTSYKVDKITSDQLLSIIPNKYRSDFYTVLVSISGVGILPHIDDNIKTTINFYVNTAGGITRFHKIKPNAKPDKNHFIKNLNEQTDGGLFEEKDLDEVASFKAEDGDIYILNVKEIHSVKCESYGTRNIYSLMTCKYSFDEVVDILNGG
jgi:hypothetical protein